MLLIVPAHPASVAAGPSAPYIAAAWPASARPAAAPATGIAFIARHELSHLFFPALQLKRLLIQDRIEQFTQVVFQLDLVLCHGRLLHLQPQPNLLQRQQPLFQLQYLDIV